MTLLISGSFDEKMQFIFQFLDSNNKSYLSGPEYETFLDAIMTVALICNSGDLSAFFNHDSKRFFDRMRNTPKNKDKVKYSDIQKELLTSSFLKYCGDEDRKLTRAKTLQRIQSFMEGEKNIRTQNSSTFHEESTLDGTLAEQGEITKEHALDRLESLEESKLEHQHIQGHTTLSSSQIAEDPHENDQETPKAQQEESKAEDTPKNTEEPVNEELVEEQKPTEQAPAYEPPKQETQNEESSSPQNKKEVVLEDEPTDVEGHNEPVLYEFGPDSKTRAKVEIGQKPLQTTVEEPQKQEEIIFENLANFFPLLADTPESIPAKLGEADNSFLSKMDKPLLSLAPAEILQILKKPVTGTPVSPLSSSDSHPKDAFNFLDSQALFEKLTPTPQASSMVPTLKPIRRPFAGGSQPAPIQKDERVEDDAPVLSLPETKEQYLVPQEPSDLVAVANPIGKALFENAVNHLAIPPRDHRPQEFSELEHNIFGKPSMFKPMHEPVVASTSVPKLEKQIFDNFVAPQQKDEITLVNFAEISFFENHDAAQLHHGNVSYSIPGQPIGKKLYENFVQPFELDQRPTLHHLSDEIFKNDVSHKEHHSVELCPPGLAAEKKFYENSVLPLELDTRITLPILTEDIFKPEIHQHAEHSAVNLNAPGLAIGKKFYENNVQELELDNRASHHVFSDIFKTDHLRQPQEPVLTLPPGLAIKKQIFENNADFVHPDTPADSHILTDEIFRVDHALQEQVPSENCPPGMAIGKKFFENPVHHAELDKLHPLPLHEVTFHVDTHPQHSHEQVLPSAPLQALQKKIFENLAVNISVSEPSEGHLFDSNIFTSDVQPQIHHKDHISTPVHPIGKKVFTNHIEAYHLSERAHPHELKESIFHVDSHPSLSHEHVNPSPQVAKLGVKIYQNAVPSLQPDTPDTTFFKSEAIFATHDTPVQSQVPISKPIFDRPTKVEAPAKKEEFAIEEPKEEKPLMAAPHTEELATQEAEPLVQEVKAHETEQPHEEPKEQLEANVTIPVVEDVQETITVQVEVQQPVIEENQQHNSVVHQEVSEIKHEPVHVQVETTAEIKASIEVETHEEPKIEVSVNVHQEEAVEKHEQPDHPEERKEEPVQEEYEKFLQPEEKPPREYEDVIVLGETHENETLLSSPSQNIQYESPQRSTNPCNDSEIVDDPDAWKNATFINADEINDSPTMFNPIATDMKERPSPEVLSKRKKEAEMDLQLQKKGGENCKVCSIF